MTAVEWLLEQIEKKNGYEFTSYYSEFVNQAKEMEKEQLCIFYNRGAYDEIIGAETTALMRYYETFKK